jgi:transposase
MKNIWQEHKEIVLDNNSLSDETTSHEIIPWWHRLRKHAAHRRTILAALTFGIAAGLNVIAVVLRYFVDKQDDDHEVTADRLDMASVYVYILSAVISITGKRIRPWLSPSSPGCTAIMINDSERLQDMGDLLFLIGSLVDGSMWYFMVQDQPAWSLVSSVLWFLDACFYLRSDVVMAERATSKRNDLLV